MTAVIILNWNGADDTLACMKSLANAKGDFRVYIVDNGSSDDSLQRINDWLTAHASFDARLVALDKNYGFARGNNKGIAFARNDHPDAYILLNNDTEVKPDFLVKLHSFSSSYPKYRVLTPKINLYYDKERIWNCGGKLFFGLRKYYYAGQLDVEVKEKVYIPISFVTGCALFFYPELLDEEGCLLTERFFFGEEDFEFSMRMCADKVAMACVLDSLIYHKVGSSGMRMNSTGKLYMHYLNRFIDVRHYFGSLKYVLWLMLNIPLVLFYFYNATHKLIVAIKLLRRLLCDVYSKDGVNQEDFESLVLKHNYFTFKL